MKGQGSRCRLRDDRGQGRPDNAQLREKPPAEDQERLQHDEDGGKREDDVHGQKRLPLGAQKIVGHHQKIQEGRAEDDQNQILPGQRQDVLRRSESSQNGVMEDQDGKDGQHAQRDRQQHHLTGCPPGLFDLAGSEHSCREGPGPDPGADTDRPEKHLDGKTERQCGKRLGAEPGKPEAVDQVGYSHGEHGRDGRPAHFQQQGENRLPAQIKAFAGAHATFLYGLKINYKTI